MPRVFISYSHDSREHERRVLALADRLRSEGIDAIVDQYEPHPAQGWPRWCERQIVDAQFVLIVCTEAYHRRFFGDLSIPAGYGVCWEAHLIYQSLYASPL